jgi:hypothetical protein
LIIAPILIALMLLGTASAWAAEEPSGCDKFKWNSFRFVCAENQIQG